MPGRSSPTSTDLLAPPGVPQRTDRLGGRRAWVITAMVTAFMMINFADKAVLGLAAGALQKDLGLTPEQYGTIASAFFLLFSVSALGVGYIADRFSTKKVLFALSLLWGFAMLPVVGPAGFTILLISRLVLGAAEGPAFGVAQHAMQQWFDSAGRSLPASIITVGTNLGVVISAPILAWLIAQHGWRSAFVALAIVSFIWCGLWLVVGRDGPANTAPATKEATDVPQSAGNPLDHLRIPVWRILMTGSWLGCVLASFAAYWSVSLLVAWLPPYLTFGLGYTPQETGSLTTIPWAVGGALMLMQGWFTQRLMRRGVSSRLARGVLAGVLMVASGICTILFAYRGAGFGTLVLIALGFGLFGAIFPIATTVCGEVSPTDRRGIVLGTFVAIYSLSGILAPYVAGKLVGQAGAVPLSGYQTVFVMSGVILAIGGLAALLLINPGRDVARLLATSARNGDNA